MKAWDNLMYPDSQCVALVTKHFTPSGFCLDIGCGGGRHAKMMMELGHKVFAVDSDIRSILVCKKRGVQAQLADVSDSMCDLTGFDYCLAWGFTMLNAEAKHILANTKAKVIIADWRTPSDSIMKDVPMETWIDASGDNWSGVKFYTHYGYDLLGYERVHQQTMRISRNGKINEWIQIVYNRA